MDDDLPPPPYSLRDPGPHNSSSALPSIPSQDISIFNAFLDHPNFNPASIPIAGGAAAQTSFQVGYSAQSRSPVSPTLTAPTGAATRVSGSIMGDDLQRAGFVSATPYFELRSPSLPRPADTFYHHMTVAPDACPENLPFPQPQEKWSQRGVDSQDWMTFLNHLFPQHIVDKENRGDKELEADAELDIGGLNLGSRTSTVQSRDQSHPLLANSSASGRNMQMGGRDRETDRLRQVRIEAVTAQWNGGFFGPRGLEVIFDFITPTSATQVEPRARRSSSNVLQKKPPPEMEETLLHQAVAKGKKSTVKELLKSGSEDIEALNKKGETALYRAVTRGEKDIVQTLLENGANPLSRPPYQDSPLHVAVHNDKKTIVKFLLDKSRLGIEELSSKGETPLYAAVRRQHKACIELLLGSGANPNARPVGQESMLNLAVSNDYKSTTKLLLERGVNLEERNKNGETPLFRAVSRGNTSIVKLLLDHGASAASRTAKGEAPISLAVTRGDNSTVLLLLAQKDVDVDAENENGQTPLYNAISRGDTSIAEQLLRKGANPSFHPPNEETALNLAMARCKASLIHLLLERGADFEEKNRSGESPVFQAVSRSDTSILSILLVKGASANTNNLSGETALYRAVYREETSLVSLLLTYGADPEVALPGAEAPLYLAASRANTSIVSLLLAKGAHTETRGPTGETPLCRAIYVSSTAIVSILLSHGADAGAKTASGESLTEYAIKRGNKTIAQIVGNYAALKPPEKE
jgi:ankyrin repeat protein